MKLVFSDLLDRLKPVVRKNFGALLFLGGISLRLLSALWPESFWYDEMVTLYFAKLPVANSFFVDNHPPTFFLTLKLWLAAIGPVYANSEPALRLLPFVFSAIGLAVVFKGWKSTGVRVAMALNPASIFFASEVRHHSLFELMSIVFVFSATRFWNQKVASEKSLSAAGNSKSWLLLFAAVALVLSHFLGVLLILSFFVMLLLASLIGSHKRKQNLVLAFLFLGFFLFIGWGLNKYWIRSDFLGSLTTDKNGLFWHQILEPLLVVGSYSRVWTLCIVSAVCVVAVRGQSESLFYARWTLFYFLATFIAEFVFDRSLGLRKFMIPAHVLTSVALGLGAIDGLTHIKRISRRRMVVAVLFFGLVINGKKIVEDLVGLRSGWKSVAQRECHTKRESVIQVWGHPSFDFYFSRECAEVSRQIGPGIWFVSEDLANEMMIQKGYSFDLLEVIEPKALEPIHVYRVKKRTEG